MKNSINFKKLGGVLVLSLVSAPMFASNAETGETSFIDDPLNLALIIASSILLTLLITLGYIVNKVARTRALWINKKLFTFLMVSSAFLYSSNAFAGEETVKVVEQSGISTNTVLLITLNIILLSLVLYMKRLLGKVFTLVSGVEPKESVLASLFEESEILPDEELLLDHDYDGIRELDNNLPPWWIGMFYLSIIFGVIYIPYYHFSGGGQLQEQEYLTEMQEAEEEVAAYVAKRGNMVDETNAKAATSEAALAKGQETYLTKCSACHGQAAEGLVGPNLTDKNWLYGGGIRDVFKTIKYGVPAKGMIAWKNQLTPSQIVEVASYILTLQGTNPPNAKAPQGDLYDPSATEENPETAVVDSTAH